MRHHPRQWRSSIRGAIAVREHVEDADSGHVFQGILEMLDPKALGRAMCVCRKWRLLASADILWQRRSKAFPMLALLKARPKGIMKTWMAIFRQKALAAHSRKKEDSEHPPKIDRSGYLLGYEVREREEGGAPGAEVATSLVELPQNTPLRTLLLAMPDAVQQEMIQASRVTIWADDPSIMSEAERELLLEGNAHDRFTVSVFLLRKRDDKVFDLGHSADGNQVEHWKYDDPDEYLDGGTPVSWANWNVREVHEIMTSEHDDVNTPLAAPAIVESTIFARLPAGWAPSTPAIPHPITHFPGGFGDLGITKEDITEYNKLNESYIAVKKQRAKEIAAQVIFKGVSLNLLEGADYDDQYEEKRMEDVYKVLRAIEKCDERWV